MEFVLFYLILSNCLDVSFIFIIILCKKSEILVTITYFQSTLFYLLLVS
jgi:hypothetical protein